MLRNEASEISNSKLPGSRQPPPRSMSGDFESYAGKAAPSGPHSDQVSTCALSATDSASEVGEEPRGFEAIAWNELRYGGRIKALRAYAHCVGDVYLLDAFLSLAELPDIDGESVKLLLRAFKLLRLCDYSVEDLCSILAHASAYFIDAFGLCGSVMDASEVGNVLATLMFIAHCYVQDETCPLHVWHQHLFRKYCPLRTLNAAIIRLLEIRRYVLRLDSQDLSTRYVSLFKSTEKHADDAEAAPLASTKNAILRKVGGSGGYPKNGTASPRSVTSI